MIKTYWVQANFEEVKDMGALKKKVVLGKVDGTALTLAINRCLKQIENEGFELVSLAPITSGGFKVETFDTRRTKQFGMNECVTDATDTCSSYGYSFTEGVIIVAKLKAA